MSRLVGPLVVAFAVVSAASAATAPPIRPARPADFAQHDYPVSYYDWYQLHAVDPRSGRRLMIRIETTGTNSLEVDLFDGARSHWVGFNVEDPWRALTISRVGRDWEVDLHYVSFSGDLRLSGRPGVTVGPWQLGRQLIPNSSPARWEHGSLLWSALVPAGRLDGWIQVGSARVDVRGWRGYLDHTWGKMDLHSRAYQHWDFAAKHPARGESWVLEGLEIRSGHERDLLTWWKPRDRAWRGVLVHMTRHRVMTCRPRVRRRGWFATYSGAHGSAGPYPSQVTAWCGASRVTFRIWVGAGRWRDSDRNQYSLGWGPTPDRAGFIQHIVPTNDY